MGTYKSFVTFFSTHFSFPKPVPSQNPNSRKVRIFPAISSSERGPCSPNSKMESRPGPIENKSILDFAEYEHKIVNNLGFFAMSRTKVGSNEVIGYQDTPSKAYNLEDTSPLAKLIYWFFYVNTGVKAVFLAFLVTDYFGPVVFLDKIAALDYILCVGIVTFGSCIWFMRYPLYEILHSSWKIENKIFNTLGCPEELKLLVDKRHHSTVWIHLCIVWFGCCVLVTQFYADPKYCVWTYSAFQFDNWYLRVVFVIHEFFFMMHPWNNMTGSSSLCTFQGIALANIIDRMTEVLEGFRFQEVKRSARAYKNGVVKKTATNISIQEKLDTNISKSEMTRSNSYKSVEELIFDYKQLMIISEQFNSWVSYKIVFLHACGYCQFISDVFVAMQVLKMPGAGFWDVWFYIEDSLASMYMIYRVYKYMSRVEPSSVRFLRTLAAYLTVKTSEKRRLRKVSKTLKAVSLKLGPCPVTPMTVLQALDMLGNYYVCVALWD